MKKTFLLLCLVFSFALMGYSQIHNEDKELLYQRFLKQYNAGDLFKAEETLHLYLESKIPLSDRELSSTYNSLGVINTLLGKFDIALEYYDKALLNNKQSNSEVSGDIYVNRARIYTLKKSFYSAIEYFEKAIRIYSDINHPDKTIFKNIASSYLNIGIVYYEINNLKVAQEYFEKSADLRIRYNLTGLAFVYLNLAKTYSKLAKTNSREVNLLKAEKFYLKSISDFKKEFGDGYYRTAEVYFDYGLFLRSAGRNVESIEILKQASSICVKNYGEKHTLTSLSYKLIGDHYKNLSDYPSALVYYQKALISVSNNFNNPDIFTNPSIDSSLFDIRLLDNLKSKAQVLELFAAKQDDPGTKLKTMTKSLETVDLALQLIDRIRNNYMSEESRIYLAENEKETYMFAAHLAYSLYSTTHDISMGYKMYGIAQKAKAAVLRNEITGNQLLYSVGIPDSLREKQNNLAANIAAYNNLILEETRKTDPDNSKITLWKDALFDMNREKERVTGDIERVFPRYHDLIRKTEPVPLELIQKKLKKDETIIDYLLSNQYSEGKRKLYIFLISRGRLDFRESWIDSLFVKNAEIIRETANPSVKDRSLNNNFGQYTGALNYMYLNLVEPVEELLKGKKLIIIPDEEIGWLSFDAFLKNMPRPGQTDYERLHYLINDYTFSYGYSSSLIFSKSNFVMRGEKVYAFSPDYMKTAVSDSVFTLLNGAGVEIGSIYKWFKGKSFYGEKATKANFITALNNRAVFHLAMHSMSDSVNSKYSYLMFDTHNLSQDEGKLYNYEISLTRINSPMIVLSSCNSGAGTLYSGEGLMSMARGFTLAGASSVIKTAWEINDETSTAIITRFYYYLSLGKEKNEAMRLAKLEYLKKSPPAFTDPYYWAAYEVLGGNAPVAINTTRSEIVVSLVMILSAGIILFYLKRRRIFSDRSR